MTPRECDGCNLPAGRREFLKQAMGITVVYLFPGGVKSAAETVEYAIPLTDGALVDRDNDVIVMRWQQVVYAFSLACPHQNTALRWRPEHGRFQCPKHQSRYQPDGTFISGRATRGMDRFMVYRMGASVVVDLSKLYSQKDEPAAWAGAMLLL